MKKVVPFQKEQARIVMLTTRKHRSIVVLYIYPYRYNGEEILSC